MDKTLTAIKRQLSAMNMERNDIGVRSEADNKMILREKRTATEIEQAISWFRHKNANGHHIYIRPHGIHGLTLVDDLTIAGVERMKAEGYAPALVVQTSPGNLQAWIKHGEILDTELSTVIAKSFAKRYGGDPSSADWRHFGRLAGFTNPKPKYRTTQGRYPYTLVMDASGQVYPKAKEYLTGARSWLEEKKIKEKVVPPTGSTDIQQSGVHPLSSFHADARYGGDLHRADMAWAKHAAGSGMGFEEIRAGLLQGRDLTKKGGADRQTDYAERTARKAIEQSSNG